MTSVRPNIGGAGRMRAQPADRRSAQRFLGDHPRLVAGAFVVVLVAIPMVVALVVLADPRWYPTLDLAQTEMRIRSVASAHPPLIGLPGRLGDATHQGSHPGPMSFWLLWPFYQLFGGSAWAMAGAACSLHLAAIATALWLAGRRHGVALILAVGAVVAVLVRSYTMATLTQAWNPYLPVMVWLVVLLAVWSVLDGDLVALPVLVFAGSFCMQTHLPYLGLAGVLVVFAAAGAAWRTLRRGPPRVRRDLLRWSLVSLGVGIVLWTPPVVNQLTESPGNLTLIWRDLTNPPQPAGGLDQGVRLLLVHLDPWKLISGQVLGTAPTASVVPGVVFLLVWLVSAGMAWSLRRRSLITLDVTLAAVLVLSLVSMSKIYGPLYFYLTLWAWGTCALMVVAVGWSLWDAADGLARARGRRHRALAGEAALVAATLVFAAMVSVDARTTQVPSRQLSRTLAGVTGPTLDALRSGTVPTNGRHGRYLVTWTDPIALGVRGYGLLDELDRAGFEIGALPTNWGGVPPRQLVEPADARVIVHLSVGMADIRAWRAKPGFVELVFVDGRSAAERREYARLRAGLIHDLRAAGRSNLVPGVDTSLVAVGLSGHLPAADRAKLTRMADIGLPAAVFAGPGGPGRG